MAARKPKNPTSAKKEVSAAEFPALRQFLRGYLHEDWMEEYDSPAEAVRQFLEDADTTERQQLASEWQTFRERTKTEPLAAVGKLLTDKLGSSWRPRTPEELEGISLAFRL
jgi:CdiI immunity protein